MKRYISIFLCLSILIQLFSLTLFCDEILADTNEYPQVSAQMLRNEMADISHPFLIVNESSFQKVKYYGFGRDNVITTQYSLIKDEATSLLDKPLIVVNVNNIYITEAVQLWKNIMNLAFVYRVEGIEAYAMRAYEQALVFCNMPSWGTEQLIDNVQVAFGVALCYDWLYDWLNNEQKQILINALKEKHLNMMSDLYNNPNKPEYKWSFYQHVFGGHNHAVMDNSLTFLSSMAIAEENMDFHTDIMAHSLKNMEKPFSSLYPDASTKEGVGYWTFIGPYIARLLITMENSFGHCFGYDNIPWIVNLSDFPIYAQSTEGAFIWDEIYNFVHVVDPTIYTFGILKEDISLQKYAIDNLNIDNTPDPVFCLMYNPLTEYNVNYEPSTDKLFSNIGMVTMRNTWDAEQQVWCGFSAMKKDGTNSHMMDCGTIGFDALGERWIMNHGRENYYDDYRESGRWNYYRTRTESQSCIVINPSTSGGQNLVSNVGIDDFVSGQSMSYAISDLTDAYSTQVNSYKRGVMLCNNKESLVVQDELTMPDESEVYSFFNIYKPSDIIFGSDGKSAIIEKCNKKLYVSVDCDEEFTFGVMNCEPLPTSPVPVNPNSPNPDYKKLYIYFDNVDSLNIRVTFTPYLCDNELEFIENTSFVPMSQWHDDETSAQIPVLEGIKLNGVDIKDFNSMDRYYEITESSLPSTLSAYADEEKYNVSINRKNNGSLYEITVSDRADSSNINTYVVALTHQPQTTNPQATYTHSAYSGIMLPQEFYRIGNNSALSAMYFKDTAPRGATSAILTIYAEPVGFSVNTNLKACSLLETTDLNYISGSNTTVTKNLTSKIEQSSLNKASLYKRNMQKLEYDITPLLPKNGGEYVFALLPVYQDDDYMVVASHRNSDSSLRPHIKYYVKSSE